MEKCDLCGVEAEETGKLGNKNVGVDCYDKIMG